MRYPKGASPILFLVCLSFQDMSSPYIFVVSRRAFSLKLPCASISIVDVFHADLDGTGELTPPKIDTSPILAVGAHLQ